jgi:hypothetical protein
MAGFYGLGQAFQSAVEGYDAGNKANFDEQVRQRQLVSADNALKIQGLQANTAAEAAQANDVYRQNLKTNLDDPSYQDPLFSPETNYSKAALAAARATGSPALIQDHLLAYDKNHRNDIFSETVNTINQAKNSNGPVDVDRLNQMYKAGNFPVQIQSIAGDSIVATGPGGAKTFTLQGFMNDAARVLDPKTAYTGIQTQIDNQQAQRAAQTARQNTVLDTQAKQEFDMRKQAEKAAYDRETERLKLEAQKIREGITDKYHGEVLNQGNKRIANESQRHLDTVDTQSRKEFAASAPDEVMAKAIDFVNVQINKLHRDPASFVDELFSKGLNQSQVRQALAAGGVGGPARSSVPTIPPPPYAPSR